ncbi:uncharacterized protein LOC123529395 [Mercenaria mercenaria]|uniref:uncharacterized protein LOC123529395 n=1 Tax=Mercenaria mercenaria TaxID=6596 RepID=UPI001E1DE17E|nr:uncharacterized protein LOC123529395 [Mercenaria mercenaria]
MRFQLVVVTIVTVVAGIHGRYTPRRGYSTQINWKNFFCSTWFHWPWLKDANLVSYSTERVSQTQSLVNDCKVDVGTCPVGSCFKCPDSGYICSQTETRTHECAEFGTWEYQYVTQCVCCTDHGITVNVKVVDSETKSGIDGISITFGRSHVGDTDADGSLTTVISSDTRKLVISAIDSKNGDYIANVKHYDLAEGFHAPVEAELMMVKKALPFEIHSTKTSRIYLSENPQDLSGSNEGKPFIEVSPKSFTKARRQVYTGSVKVSVNIIETNSEDSEPVIPGRYQTFIGNDAKTLIPQLTFAIDFRDSNNEKIRLTKNLKFSVNNDMTIWNIDFPSGYWKASRTVSITGRRKRQTDEQTQFLATIVNGQWTTVGQVSNLPNCYIKTRVFDESSSTEISSTSTAIFQPEIVATNSNNQKIRFYTGSTNSPGNTCFQVGCPTDFPLSGTIQLKVTEAVSGSSTSFVTYLTPKLKEDYDVSLYAKLDSVTYDLITLSQQPGAYAKFISDPIGPFYEDISTCEASSVGQPSFHFIKSDLPTSSVSSTTSARLCTARVRFDDGDNQIFYRYLSGLTTLPTVKAISAWYEGQTTYYYYTDFAKLEHATSAGYYFACLKYRCAPDDPRNESIGNTALYFDIEIPDKVLVDVKGDGSLIEYSVDCSIGNCAGPFCKTRYEYNEEKNFIDASRWVENDKNMPGSFFMPADETCSTSTDHTNFAHTIRCHFETPGN